MSIDLGKVSCGDCRLNPGECSDYIWKGIVEEKREREREGDQFYLVG